MADLTRCTGRSEAPAEGHGGAHSFSSRPVLRRAPFCTARPCPAGLGEKAVRDAGTFAGGGACLGGVWDEVTEEVFPVFRT